MSSEQAYNLFMSMLRNKEQIVRELTRDLDVCTRTKLGCIQVDDQWDLVEKDHCNALKKLRTAIKTNGRLAAMLEKLILINLTTLLSGDFDANAAKVAMKLAPKVRETEQLQEMLKNKIEE